MNLSFSTTIFADTRGELTDSLAETDIGTRDGLAGDQPFADKLDDLGVVGEFRVIERVGASTLPARRRETRKA